MTQLYTIAELVAATQGHSRNIVAEAVSSISIDSREIAHGALFVAIRGENFDGHDFVGTAIEAGAVAALVSEKRAGGYGDLPLIVVPDALEGLNAIAHYARERSTAKIVAVTGSVGKTTTKEAIRAVLSSAGRTHASIKSFNNHWGVPLMLARMPADTEFGVFEIGMSAAGEITPLSRLVRPHVAVVTTVAPAHLEFFDSEEAIADAKAEIFSGLEPDGTAIIGIDHAHAARLVAHARDAEAHVTTYGFDDGADVRIEGYAAIDGGGQARVEGTLVALDVAVPTPGRHTLFNAVGALVAAQAVGVDPQKAVSVLAHHGAGEGRGAWSRLGPQDTPLVLIDESYNANPLSMRAALDVFSQIKQHGGRKFLVLGDMRELGAAARQMHEDLHIDVIAAEPDGVFLVGEEMDALGGHLPTSLVMGKAHTVEEIAPKVLDTLAFGDSVMVKGSNGLRLGSLVTLIRRQFAT